MTWVTSCVFFLLLKATCFKMWYILIGTLYTFFLWVVFLHWFLTLASHFSRLSIDFPPAPKIQEMIVCENPSRSAPSLLYIAPIEAIYMKSKCIVASAILISWFAICFIKRFSRNTQQSSLWLHLTLYCLPMSTLWPVFGHCMNDETHS